MTRIRENVLGVQNHVHVHVRVQQALQPCMGHVIRRNVEHVFEFLLGMDGQQQPVLGMELPFLLDMGFPCGLGKVVEYILCGELAQVCQHELALDDHMEHGRHMERSCRLGMEPSFLLQLDMVCQHELVPKERENYVIRHSSNRLYNYLNLTGRSTGTWTAYLTIFSTGYGLST